MAEQGVAEKSTPARHPIRDIVRQARGAVGELIRGVSGRGPADEALRRAGLLYENLIESARDIVYTMSTEGRIISLNPVFESVTGWSRAEWVGGRPDAILHADDRPKVMDAIRRVLKGETPRLAEARILSKSGEYLVLEGAPRPLIVGGKVVGVFGSARGVREDKRAEEALRESEERYRTLVESARDVIYTLSADGTILSLNSEFETITGWSRAEWLGKPFAPLVHPDDLPPATSNYRRALSGESPPRIELRILSKSGEYLAAEMAARPLIRDGDVVGTVGIARDITERRRAEEELRESEERYRRLADNAPDIIFRHRFAPTPAYEYVSPAVTAITGYSPKESHLTGGRRGSERARPQSGLPRGHGEGA